MEVSPPEKDPCRKGRRQFAALLLNIASERLTTCQELVQGGSVQDAIDSIKVYLTDGRCKEAQELAGSINEGDALVPCDNSFSTRFEHSISNPASRLSTPLKEITLFSKTPNPIKDEAILEFHIPVREPDESASILLGNSPSSPVSLIIYNLAGQKVKTLIDGEMETGTHHVYWNGLDERGTQAPSGIYFARLALGNTFQTRKLVVLR
jgi:hypothetical protein